MEQKQHKMPKCILNAIPYLVTFLITLGIGLFAFHAEGMYPFGEKAPLVKDMFWQYFPMYAMDANPDAAADAFYSWCGGLGFNNWAQNAYYCNSVFLLLFRFLPLDQLINALDIFCLLKIALSSVTCLALLRYRCGKPSPLLIGGAVSYSLSTYMIAYMAQAMWTDCVIYAPLVVLGLERLLQERKPLLYTVSLAVAIISSFYIGFAICLFLVFYFLAREGRHLPDKFRKKVTMRRSKAPAVSGGKAFLWDSVWFAGSSLLAGGLAACVILPIGMSIGQTIASEMASPDTVKWYHNIFEFLQQFLPESIPVYAYDYANLAVGALIFLSVPVYFCNKEIRPVERIVNGLLVIFLFASLNCNVLDYMWHGFHFPNQLPARWSFLLDLYLVLLGTEGLARHKGLTIPRALIGEAAGVLILVLTCMAPGSERKGSITLMWGCILFAEAVVLLLLTYCTELSRHAEKEERKKKLRILSAVCVVALAVVQIADSGANFIRTSADQKDGLLTSSGDYFTENLQTIQDNTLPCSPGDNAFYRVVYSPYFTFNPCMAGGYPGMSIYSSTMQGSVYELLRYTGNWVYAKNVSSIYNADSPVQNTIYGVGRFVSSDSKRTFPGTTPVSSDGLPVYENNKPLSIAYGVSKEILDLQVTNDIRAIANQNTMLNALLGEEANVYMLVEPSASVCKNASLSDGSSWETTYFSRTDPGEPVTFHYEYEIKEPGSYYLEHNFRAGTMTVTYGDRSQVLEKPVRSQFLCMDDMKAGDRITVDVEIENIRTGCQGLNVYRLNEAAWDAAYAKLKAGEMQLETFDTTRFSGTVSMAEEGYVMATVPQDGGWEVRCDGKKLEVQKAAGALICVKVPAGTHKLTFRYHVPGLLPGGILTVISLLLLLFFGIPRLREMLLKRLPHAKA